MDPAKDEEALYEQLYNELISSGSNKRDRGATDGYVDAQEFKRLKAELNSKTQECVDLQGQVSELQLQVKKLTRMKETLADNISSLFKTAAAELARKDGQNKEMSARLRAVQGAGSVHFNSTKQGRE